MDYFFVCQYHLILNDNIIKSGVCYIKCFNCLDIMDTECNILKDNKLLDNENVKVYFEKISQITKLVYLQAIKINQK